MIVICLPHLHNKGSPIPRPLFDNGNDPYRTSVSTTLSTLTNNGIPHISIVQFRVNLKQFLLLLLSMKFSIFFRSNNVKITFWRMYNSPFDNTLQMGGNALELYFTQPSLLLTIFCKVYFVMYGVCALSGVWNRVAIADRHAPNCTSTHFISWSGLSKLTENCLGLIVQGSSWAWLGWLQGLACLREQPPPPHIQHNAFQDGDVLKERLAAAAWALYFCVLKFWVLSVWALSWHLWIFNATHKEKNMHNHGVSYNYLDMAFSTIISSWLPYSRKME